MSEDRFQHKRALHLNGSRIYLDFLSPQKRSLGLSDEGGAVLWPEAVLDASHQVELQ